MSRVGYVDCIKCDGAVLLFYYQPLSEMNALKALSEVFNDPLCWVLPCEEELMFLILDGKMLYLKQKKLSVGL